jgi:hypothetical protein
MDQAVPDVLAEVVELAFDLLVTVLLTGAGVSAELHSVELLGTDQTMALWFAYMGLVALYAGVVVFGGDRVASRLQRRFAGDT